MTITPEIAEVRIFGPNNCRHYGFVMLVVLVYFDWRDSGILPLMLL